MDNIHARETPMSKETRVKSKLRRRDGSTADVVAITTPAGLQTQAERDKLVADKFAARLAAQNKGKKTEETK